MAGQYADRVALVTGASSGLGRAVALALGREAASVAIAARRADRLDALAAEIEAAGGKALVLAGDVSDETTATGFVERTVAHFGRLDILVNAAGLAGPSGVEHGDMAEWRRVLEINLLATLYTCKAAIGPMKAQGSGDIINISSTAGRRASKSFMSYTASKHGVNAMTEGLRQEVGGYGIRVCVLEPGATTTNVAESIVDPKAREDLRQHVSRQGVMKPEDVAETILFILSLPRRANVSEILIRPTIDTVWL